MNKFTEYIGIAIDGDFIALDGCALTNCNTREAVFGLFASATYCSHCKNGVKKNIIMTKNTILESE